MKKVILAVICLGFAVSASAESLKQTLNSVGHSGSYSDRYELILDLCNSGVVLFDGTHNPYTSDDTDESVSCYQYIGNAAQNAKLQNNIQRNKSLIRNGALVDGAAAQWVIVE